MRKVNGAIRLALHTIELVVVIGTIIVGLSLLGGAVAFQVVDYLQEKNRVEKSEKSEKSELVNRRVKKYYNK